MFVVDDRVVPKLMLRGEWRLSLVTNLFGSSDDDEGIPRDTSRF
jgi:hypothetical protein